MSAELNQQKQELEPTPAAKQDASRSLFLNPESLNPKTYIPVIPKAKTESEADYRNRENVRNTVYGRTLIQGEFSLPYDADLDENLFAGDSQEEVRAQNQGFLGETGRGAVKFTNEVVLGTASAVGRLLDFPSYVEMWDSENKDYTNLFSAAVDAVKEDINEKYGKVYVASENKGFSPFSWESWMDNAGNLGTTLSLMLPSMGLVKGLSAAAKGVGAVSALRAAAVMGEATSGGAGAAELGMFANAAKKIGQFATSSGGKATLKGITGASFSRYVEGGMEAEGAQEEYRNSMIEYYDQNGNPIYKVKDKVTGARFTAEEVEVAAGKVAASTFKNNAWLAAIDLFQYRTAFKGMDMARRNAEAIASSTVKKNIFKQAGKFVAEQGISEGAEEGFQYIAKEEAKYDQLLANKLVDESTFTDRLLQYVDEDEFKTSVLHGAVGGILFGGGMEAMNYKDSKKQKQYLQGLVDSYKAQDAALTGNAAAFNAAQRNVIINNAAQKAKDGTLSVLEADLNTLSLATDEELKSQGVDVADYRDKIAKSKELVATVASEYNKAVNNPNLGEKYAASYAAARAHQKSLDFQEIAESKEIEKLKNEDLEVFKSRDASVANLMVAAKEARRVGDKEKYDKKIKDILEESSVYKTSKEVEEALATSQDTKYHEIAKSTARRKADKEELKILIDDMFTEDGKQKIDKAVEQNVVKDVVKEGIETSLGNTVNPEELSIITNAAQATANAKIEELKNNGEYSENKAAAIIAETIKEFSGVTQPEETAETENSVSQTIGDKPILLMLVILYR